MDKAKPKLDERLLCINQATVLQQWSVPQFLQGMKRHGIGAISIWRDKLLENGVAETVRMLDGEGFVITSLCSGGLITSPDPAETTRAIDELKRAIDQTAAIKAGCLMFVAGGVDPRDKNLASTRARVLERLAELTPYARAAGAKLALEPLHPMTCGMRSVITSLKIANDWCDALRADDVFGIAVDTYAVWWDPDLEREIARAGKRIIGFHVNDWLADTNDLRLDRGMMGDGVIDIAGIRRMVEATGYDGYREVEIFSQRNWWKRDPDEVIRVVKERYQTSV